MNNLNKYCFLNIEKIVQIFHYIQKHTNTTSKLELIKYLFFADRIHIREYFSLISLDTYVAMQHGPVASISLDILNKNAEYLSNYIKDELKYLENVIETSKYDRKIKEVTLDLISKNEMNSLDKSIQIFSGKRLVELTHDYPEWKRFKELFDNKYVSKMNIVMDDFFKNPIIGDSPAINKYLNGVDPLYKDDDYLNEARQFYLESTGQYGL